MMMFIRPPKVSMPSEQRRDVEQHHIPQRSR